ncbi:MAG: hypothetical protein ACKVVP_08090 [Chloroflexota bacterium]
MSIYATAWEMALPVWVEGKPEGGWAGFAGTDNKGRSVYQRFIRVRAQMVPAHIGNEGYGDLYADFLPPPVEYDEHQAERRWTPRAVVIVDEDHAEKDVQRYPDPLLVLTGAEYESADFAELLDRIQDALEERFGARPQQISIGRSF